MTDLRVPPDGTEASGGASVARLLELALPVATVDARRDHRVTEPGKRSRIWLIGGNIVELKKVIESSQCNLGTLLQYKLTK